MSNDDDDKINSSDSDNSSANDTAGTNRKHPTLTRQATGKGKSKCGKKKQERPGRKAGKTMTFGEGTNFTAIGRKKVATVRSVNIKVANSPITDEVCMQIYSHADTFLLGKEFPKVYD